MALNLPAAQKSDRGAVIMMPVFIARPGYSAQLEEALAQLQQLSRNDDGCIAYSVFVDLALPERFVLYEEWTTEQALANHDAQSHVQKFRAVSISLLAVPFDVSLLRAVELSVEMPV